MTLLTLDQHARWWSDMVPHIAHLTELARDARVIVEFGVRGGVSTWALLDGLPDDGHMVSVDIDPDVRRLLPERVTSDRRWVLVTADDQAPDIKQWLPPRIDLLFIDTSHEYRHTIAEMELGRWLLARTIALHDYALPDVADAAHGFARRHGWSLEVEPSEWGLAILRR